MRRLLQLRRDERGSSIVEMALVAPFLATLLIGMVDISRGYSAKLQLQQAAQRAIEKAMQGKKDESLFDTLKSEGAAAAGVPEGQVAVDYWLECNGARQAEYDTVCPSGQSYARYVNVEIDKSYSPMFNTRWLGSDANGNYMLQGEAGIRVQ